MLPGGSGGPFFVFSDIQNRLVENGKMDRAISASSSSSVPWEIKTTPLLNFAGEIYNCLAQPFVRKKERQKFEELPFMKEKAMIIN